MSRADDIVTTNDRKWNHFMYRSSAIANTVIKCKGIQKVWLVFFMAFSSFTWAAKSAELYSNWSFDAAASYQSGLGSEAISLTLNYMPWQQDGLATTFALEQFVDSQLDSNTPLSKHGFSFAKLGLGYQWHMDEWQFVPQLILITPVSEDPELNQVIAETYPQQWQILGQLNLSLYYEINSRWRTVFSVGQVFSSFDAVNGSQINLGVSYRLGRVVTAIKSPGSMSPKSQPQYMEKTHLASEFVDQHDDEVKKPKQQDSKQPTPHAIMSAATPVLDASEEFQESVNTRSDYRDTVLNYTVQVGSFDQYKSIGVFVKRHKLNREHLFITKTKGYYRLFYGEYTNPKMAKIVSEQFNGDGLDSFVVNVDFATINRY